MSTVPLDADHLPEYAARLYDAGLDHPEVLRFMTWYQLERGGAEVPAVVAASMGEKVVAIKDAQRRGTVTATMPAGQILALVLTIANMWGQAAEDLVSLVPTAKRRKVVIDAVARLVVP